MSEEPPECDTCGREKEFSAKHRGYVCPGCAWNRFMGRDPRPPEKREKKSSDE